MLHFFGYTKGLRQKLQGSTLDIVQGYSEISNIKSVFLHAREDEEEYEQVYKNMTNMAEMANMSGLQIPRRCGRQTQRNNVPSNSPKEYFQRVVFIPFLDHLLSQFDMRLGGMAKQSILGLHLLPNNTSHIGKKEKDDLLNYYREDLPSPGSFHQELKLWCQLWSHQKQKSDSLSDVLSDSRVCRSLYPNIATILNILFLTSVTSCGVERANSTLKFIKNSMHSTMGEDRFNALVLLYVHKDIDIDENEIVDMYASRHPRRMLLLNPLSSHDISI